jgi:DNA polymerase III epsilon subunit-like protein
MNNNYKIFLDTEFTALQQEGELISLALVTVDGKEFYAEFTDYAEVDSEGNKVLSEWHYTNVINNLFLTDKRLETEDKLFVKGNRSEILRELETWIKNISPNETIQIWADVPHFDWVFFCQLFGGALHIPSNIHYMPMDIATIIHYKNLDVNVPRISLIDNKLLPPNLKQHNALYDAHIARLVYQKLVKP